MLSQIILGYIMILIVQSSSEEFEAPLIESNVGKIKGLKATDGDYFMYLGIPFATVDTRNPFATAVPSLVFEGVFEAFDNPYPCPHNHQKNNSVIGSLDCLRLNIYVPKLKAKQHLPVMVWIHGGSFKYGNGGTKIFGPTYLIKHNIILVTINYRVGPYGFMCLDLPEISGNQGLKDQYLALKWVKDNIEAFGGNINDITLFGEGAGAHSIDLHLMSTKEILYNKVILQSGSAQSPTVLHQPDKLAPLRMARNVGFKTSDIQEALNHLAKAGIKKVINAATNLKMQFKPCVESLFDNVEPFIASSWIDANVPKIKNIPVLMGFNKHELARSLYTKTVTNRTSSTIVYDNLRNSFNLPDKDLTELSDVVARFYFVGEDKSERVEWGVIHFISDFTYIHPIHRTLQKYLESGAKKIYFYMFSYIGERNVVTALTYDEDDSSNHLCCASHADDLAYLFKKRNQPDPVDSDETVLNRMTTMWTNFAKYGDPTPKETTLLPVKWKPVKANKLYCLNIGAELSLGQRPLHARMAFWDMFYRQNKKYQPGYEEE